MKFDRFKRRRAILRRRRLCTKCGETQARPGRCECVGCAVVKSIKSKQRREQSRAINEAIRREALAEKRALLAEALARLDAQLAA